MTAQEIAARVSVLQYKRKPARTKNPMIHARAHSVEFCKWDAAEFLEWIANGAGLSRFAWEFAELAAKYGRQPANFRAEAEKMAEDLESLKAAQAQKWAQESEQATEQTNTKAEPRKASRSDENAAPAECLQLVEIANGVAVIPADGYDYRATLIVISQKCHETLHHRLTYGKNMVFHRNPTFHLSDEHYACMLHIVKLMRDAGNLSIPRRKDILVSALDLFSLMIDEFRKSALEDNADSNLFNQFFDAIVEHYKENREVNYYAQLLCLSPKYFGNIIKQETHYVTTQAKMMLRSRRDLSIQQIGDDLGFDNQAIFSRYFKHVVGVTPSEYRQDSSIEA